MWIFNSYVSLPEGTSQQYWHGSLRTNLRTMVFLSANIWKIQKEGRTNQRKILLPGEILAVHQVSPHGYGSIPIDTFLVGWTSIYQLFWCSPGVQGFDTLPHRKCQGRLVNFSFAVSSPASTRRSRSRRCSWAAAFWEPKKELLELAIVCIIVYITTDTYRYTIYYILY
jgi:hypothetical protein